MSCILCCFDTKTDSTAGYLLVEYMYRAVPVVYDCECDSIVILLEFVLLVRHFMPENEVIVRTPRHTTKV